MKTISDDSIQQYATELFRSRNMVLAAITFSAKQFGPINQVKIMKCIESLIDIFITKIIDHKISLETEYTELKKKERPTSTGHTLIQCGVLGQLTPDPEKDDSESCYFKYAISYSINHLLDKHLLSFIDHMFYDHDTVDTLDFARVLERYKELLVSSDIARIATRH